MYAFVQYIRLYTDGYIIKGKNRRLSYPALLILLEETGTANQYKVLQNFFQKNVIHPFYTVPESMPRYIKLFWHMCIYSAFQNHLHPLLVIKQAQWIV